MNEYTYMWQQQPYKSWKGTSTNSVVPAWSRPLINGPTNTQDSGQSFKARPIKHWRKQLNPRKGSGRSSVSIGMPMDRPGGSTYLGDNPERCKCETKDETVNLKENITRTHKIVKPTPADTIYDENGKPVCVACNPETNVIKSASTIVKKNYYTDSRAYLKSRNKTYERNLSGTRNENIKYIDQSGNVLWPTMTLDGPQVRDPLSCTDRCQYAPNSNVRSRTIYKPNNRQFGVQGAVSSSSRLERLKLNTITKNGNSFKTAFGSEGANAGKYHGTSTAPYFLKSKYQKCVPHHRNGDHTNCFFTPTGSVGQGGLRGIRNITVSTTTQEEIVNKPVTTKPKILALHGGGQDLQSFAYMMSDLEDEVKNDYEIVYISAPYAGNLWILDNPGGKNDPIYTDITFVIESINVLDSALEKYSHVEGIVGYSQGAAFIPVYLSYLEQNAKNNFRFAMMFSGYLTTTHPGLYDHVKNYSPFGDILSLNFMGEQDKVIDNLLSLELEQYFTNQVVVKDSMLGHSLPTNSSESFLTVISFIKNMAVLSAEAAAAAAAAQAAAEAAAQAAAEAAAEQAAAEAAAEQAAAAQAAAEAAAAQAAAEQAALDEHLESEHLIENILVSITSTYSGNKYTIDSVQNNSLTLVLGTIYNFNHSSAHPFRFSTTPDGIHNSGTEYTTDVTTGNGITTIEITSSTPSTLYYYCAVHSGMGGTITIQ